MLVAVNECCVLASPGVIATGSSFLLLAWSERLKS